MTHIIQRQETCRESQRFEQLEDGEASGACHAARDCLLVLRRFRPARRGTCRDHQRCLRDRQGFSRTERPGRMDSQHFPWDPQPFHSARRPIHPAGLRIHMDPRPSHRLLHRCRRDRGGTRRKSWHSGEHGSVVVRLAPEDVRLAWQSCQHTWVSRRTAAKSGGRTSDPCSSPAVPAGNRAVPPDEDEDPAGNPGKEPRNDRHPDAGRPRPGVSVEASRRLPRSPFLTTARLAGIPELQVIDPQRA
jgi:hypothetical protein